MPFFTDTAFMNRSRPGGTCHSVAQGPGRMSLRRWLPPLALLVLGACAAAYDAGREDDDGFIDELPEGVRAIAAPYQDLSAVKLLDDGCYWYQYAGQVEVTMLPLRSVDGRPICARLPETHPPAAPATQPPAPPPASTG